MGRTRARGVCAPRWLGSMASTAAQHCAAVAGASVLAKTERDRMLVDLAPLHPRYGFEVNKGYGTPEHLMALRLHGPSPVHRRSWRLPGEEPVLFCAEMNG